MRNIALIGIAAWLLVGCSGKVYTVKNPLFDKENKTEGVLFYGYKVVDKPVTYDRIRNSKTGNITNSMYEDPNSEKYCEPITVTGKEVVADYDTMYSIKYEPGLFETRKFAVSLDKGMLATVNTEVTPGVKTAVESAQGIVDVLQDVSLIDKGRKRPAIKCSTNQ